MGEHITLKQENCIKSIIGEVIHGLSKAEAEEIISKPNAVQELARLMLQNLATANGRFGPAIRDFEFTIPSDYDHDTQIDTFVIKTQELKTTHHMNKNLTSQNFAKATNRLKPGKTYRVRIFPILETVTSEDCMDFLKDQNVILVGAQGLTLLQDHKVNELPVGGTISFDHKDALWNDIGNYHRLLVIKKSYDDNFEFNLGIFEDHWFNTNCLLCFSEL